MLIPISVEGPIALDEFFEPNDGARLRRSHLLFELGPTNAFDDGNGVGAGHGAGRDGRGGWIDVDRWMRP